MIVAIVSAVLSFVPAIFVGKQFSVGLGFLCYFISLIASILGFYIGKFLNEFVGDRFIVTDGGFFGLVTEKFNALYGPQIAGFLLGLVIPILIFSNVHNNKGKRIKEKAMSDNVGISKKAADYVMPLITEDEKNFSNFGTIINRNEKTENSIIYVNWELENNIYIEQLKNEIEPILIPMSPDIVKALDVDAKIFVPMRFYQNIDYEDYDETLNAYIEKEVYHNIYDYIKNGSDRETQPYDADIAKWYKYFEFVKGPGEEHIVEKSDYVHWYFDNGKTGTENDYNAFKNKYGLGTDYFNQHVIVDAETADFLSKNKIYPGTESTILFHDIETFDYRLTEIKQEGKYYTYEKYGAYPYLMNITKAYDSDFLTFISNSWNEYPDTMKLHLEFEKKSNSGTFEDFIKEKSKLYINKVGEGANYLIIDCCEIEPSLYSKGIYYRGDPLFIESAEAFRALHDLSEYSKPQREQLLKDYYASAEYKNRLTLYKQLVKFDNAKILAKAEYVLRTSSDGVVAQRNHTDASTILEYEIATSMGWQKKEVPIEILNEKISIKKR